MSGFACPMVGCEQPPFLSDVALELHLEQEHGITEETSLDSTDRPGSFVDALLADEPDEPDEPDEEDEEDAGPEPAQEEGDVAAITEYTCDDCPDAGPFKSAQGLALHRTRVHGWKKKRKAPARVGPNGNGTVSGSRKTAAADPVANECVVRLDRLQVEGLLELVKSTRWSGSLDVANAETLRAEADKVELQERLEESLR